MDEKGRTFVNVWYELKSTMEKHIERTRITNTAIPASACLHRPPKTNNGCHTVRQGPNDNPTPLFQVGSQKESPGPGWYKSTLLYLNLCRKHTLVSQSTFLTKLTVLSRSTFVSETIFFLIQSTTLLDYREGRIPAISPSHVESKYCSMWRRQPRNELLSHKYIFWRDVNDVPRTEHFPI